MIVLFRFRFFAFISLKLRPCVQLLFDMHVVRQPQSYLLTACSGLFCIFENVAFLYYVPLYPFHLSGKYIVCFLPYAVFIICNHEYCFDISLCENSINSTNQNTGTHSPHHPRRRYFTAEKNALPLKVSRLCILCIMGT